MENDNYQSLLEKFRLPELTVFTTQEWTVTARPRQVTLGSLMLLPRQPVEDFGAVSAEQAADLFDAVGRAQRRLAVTFSPDRFNLIAAMMKDPFVHFHLIPRYATPRTFAEVEWRDEDWPGLVSFSDVQTSDRVRFAVVEALGASSS